MIAHNHGNNIIYLLFYFLLFTMVNLLKFLGLLTKIIIVLFRNRIINFISNFVSLIFVVILLFSISWCLGGFKVVQYFCLCF